MNLDSETDRSPSLGGRPAPVQRTTPPARQRSWEKDREALLAQARDVLELEAQTIRDTAKEVGDEFFHALTLLATCTGKVVLTGVGKSGLIARKIAATMSSTGTTATFLHPSDAMHGDLGLLHSGDVVIAIGKSGESEELIRLLPSLKRLEVKIIGITSRRDSTLAKESDVTLYAPVEREACPLDLAPTASTTAALALGDALAITLMKMKDFRSEDFARYHPGGKLGKRLLLKVQDVMIPLDRCPVLDVDSSSIEDTIFYLSKFGLGIVLFGKGLTLEGILTDGDIRRLLQTHKSRIFDLDLGGAINRAPITISPDHMAVEALRFMEEQSKPLNVVPVVSDGVLVGVLRLHELLSVS